MKFQDLTDRRFGYWSVLSRAPNNGIITQWFCRCECGNERTVQAGHLKTGSSTSCGCREAQRTSHGQAKTMSRKYRCWRSMKSRCNNANGKDANIYFELLCDRWQTFDNFNADMPEPPSEQHELDRIDNNIGYEPRNVRWATRTEQNRNSSNCRWIKFNGETKLLTDWAKALGVTVSTLHERIQKWGIPIALSR